jgi:hypothetical protein
MPAQLGGDGRRLVLRISAFSTKIRAKLIYLLNRIKQYSPHDYDSCNAFG